MNSSDTINVPISLLEHDKRAVGATTYRSFKKNKTFQQIFVDECMCKQYEGGVTLLGLGLHKALVTLQGSILSIYILFFFSLFFIFLIP